MTALVLCPGYHPAALTAAAIAGLGLHSPAPLVFPAPAQPPYSGPALCDFLRDRLAPPAAAPPVIFVGFSAGVVGAVAASWLWSQQGGRVAAAIALDGWGVPDLTLGTIPLHRLSHDAFTHWSSALLGAGGESFWAEPAVEHLALWRSPQTVSGWWQVRPGWRSRCTAAEFLLHLLHRYGYCG